MPDIHDIPLGKAKVCIPKMSKAEVEQLSPGKKAARTKKIKAAKKIIAEQAKQAQTPAQKIEQQFEQAQKLTTEAAIGKGAKAQALATQAKLEAAQAAKAKSAYDTLTAKAEQMKLTAQTTGKAGHKAAATKAAKAAAAAKAKWEQVQATADKLDKDAKWAAMTPGQKAAATKKAKKLAQAAAQAVKPKPDKAATAQWDGKVVQKEEWIKSIAGEFGLEYGYEKQVGVGHMDNVAAKLKALGVEPSAITALPKQDRKYLADVLAAKSHPPDEFAKLVKKRLDDKGIAYKPPPPPPPPPAPTRAPTPAAREQFSAKLAKRSDKEVLKGLDELTLGEVAWKDGAIGRSFDADGLFVEGQAIHVRKIEAHDGRTFYEFQYKVPPSSAHALGITTPGDLSNNPMTIPQTDGGTASDATGIMQKFPGGAHKRYIFRSRELDPLTGKLRERNPYDSTSGAEYSQAQCYAVKVSDDVRLEYGLSGSADNRVRMRIYGDDPADVIKKFDEVNSQLGLGNVRKIPTREDKRTLAKAQLLTKFNPKVRKDLNYTVDSADEYKKRINDLWEKHLGKDAFANEVLDDVQVVSAGVNGSRKALYSKKLAKKLAGNIDHLEHHLSSTEPDVLASIIKNGPMSTHQRYDAGLFVDGMSSMEDTSTGGADGYFLRARQRNASNYSGYMEVNADEMGRLDWWGFDGDRFGKTGDNYLDERRDVAWYATSTAFYDRNEVMMPYTLTPSAIKHIRVDSSTRQRTLARLRELGVTHTADGRPVEEVLIEARW